MLKRKFSLLLLIIIFVLQFTACQSEKVSENKNEFYGFTDSLGNNVVLKEKPKKVVSLIGSYAETWVLAGGELAGVTNDAFSERNMNLPKDIKVVGTIKNPNVEEILSISPDFVLLSPDIESHVKVSQTLKKANIPCAFFKVEDFDDYLKMLNICTSITGDKKAYDKNGLLVKKQINDCLSKIDKNIKPSILFIRAFSNGAKAKSGDNITCKMLEDLGTVNIAAKHKSLLEDLSIEEIIKEDPDFIFVVTMGENSEKAMESLKKGIEKNPAWNSLSAVKNGRYIVLPKELFHYKPNAKWGESYEYLAKILYPDSFK